LCQRHYIASWYTGIGTDNLLLSLAYWLTAFNSMSFSEETGDTELSEKSLQAGLNIALTCAPGIIGRPITTLRKPD
jgi:hypothetical protein